MVFEILPMYVFLVSEISMIWSKILRKTRVAAMDVHCSGSTSRENTYLASTLALLRLYSRWTSRSLRKVKIPVLFAECRPHQWFIFALGLHIGLVKTFQVLHGICNSLYSSLISFLSSFIGIKLVSQSESLPCLPAHSPLHLSQELLPQNHLQFLFCLPICF